MGLTSEQVHWFGGACFTVVALLLMAYEWAPVRVPWAPGLLPALFVGYAVESALDPLIHGRAMPAHYATETAQHLGQGAAMLLAGVVEWARLRGRLRTAGWGLVTPAALLVVAVVFLRHAQHDAAASPAVLMVQHRAFAATLVVAGGARAAFVVAPRVVALRSAWLLPLLNFGLLLLAYTERAPRSGSTEVRPAVARAAAHAGEH